MKRDSTAIGPSTVRRRRRLCTTLALITTLAAGCAAEVDGAEAPAAPHEYAGPTDIAGAQQYLQTYGYLPSEELRQRIPNAKIIVDRPFERGLLDEPTRAALIAFQTTASLPTTGELDDATRSKMGAVRCGNIDAPIAAPHLPDADGHVEKFALQQKLTRGSAIIRVKNYPDAAGATQAKVNADIDAVALEFRRKTGFSMERRSPTTNPASGVWAIDLHFYRGAPPSSAHVKCPNFTGSGDAAVTVSWFFTSSGEQNGPIPICVNLDTNFSWGLDPIGSAFDFYSVLLHEMGHATGLGHSNVGIAAMQPFIDPGEFLFFTNDDLQAEWSRWGQWSGQASGPTSAQQVIWGPGDTLYALDNFQQPGGNFRMWRRTSSNRSTGSLVTGTWTLYDGYGVRLGYDGGRLWHINAQGMLYFRNPEDTGWIQLPGCVRDVTGTEALGMWFAAGCDGNTYFALRGDERLQHFARVGNGVKRVAYDRKYDNLWQIDAAGNLYSGFQPITKFGSGFKDISIGDDGSIWAVTTGNKARLLNRQNGIPKLNGDGTQQRDENGNLAWHAPPKYEFVPFIDRVSVRSIAGDAWGNPAMADSNSRLHDIRLFYTN